MPETVLWRPYKFSRKLTFTFGLTLIVAVGIAVLFITNAAKDHFIDELELSLETQARLLTVSLDPALFAKSDIRQLHELAHRFGSVCNCRITIIRPDGLVVGDSDLSLAELSQVENHKERSEVRAALEGRTGHAVRHSHTVGHDLLYTAIAFAPHGPVIGIIRVALPLTQVHQKLAELRRKAAWITLIILLAAVLMSLWLSSSIGQPVTHMSRAAQRLSQGDYGARVSELPHDELGELGSALNSLAQRVQSTIQELSQEKAQLSTILSNMVEAVVAVDSEGRVLAVNPALSSLFGISAGETRGKSILEVLRHSQLDKLLRSVLGDFKDRVEEIQIFSPEERVFEAHAVALTQEGKNIGALLVLHDITRIRRLENLRKEFVANVSHELRTPLASIKGLAETLRCGALEDKEHRVEFIEDIEKSADGLTRLVDDLLDLSAIESGRRMLNLEPVSLREVALEVAASLKPLAEKNKVSIHVRIPDGLPAVRADKEQMKQVFTNLFDNAIKYNRRDGALTVSAASRDNSMMISFQDTGAGIPEQDLPRIFERFYRVDKGRSRESGGTGLGLAIVKHIVEAHHGSVSVESAEGNGSTFHVTLPIHS